MKYIHSTTHPSIDTFDGKSIFTRKSTRAIALVGEEILLLYTERYHDYSLPGGGLNEGEDIICGMIRELAEETGAQNIRNIRELGIYEEYRPWYKEDFDIMHMISYCFTCEVNDSLGDTSFEHYEVSNGMRPGWINIHEAIAHNEETLNSSDKRGMSIERETFLLHYIKNEVLK